MTVDWLVDLGLSFLAGAALGSAYFAALWATVRRLPGRPRAGLWAVLSFAARVALLLAGLLLLSRWGGWPALVAALAGFLGARIAVVRALRPRAAAPEGES
jgi:F1F0 ATPase subunit 2